MALNVTAPDLVTVSVDDAVAPQVAAALAAESRSFYFEPWPNGRARISVNREHGRALLALAGDSARVVSAA